MMRGIVHLQTGNHIGEKKWRWRALDWYHRNLLFFRKYIPRSWLKKEKLKGNYTEGDELVESFMDVTRIEAKGCDCLQVKYYFWHIWVKFTYELRTEPSFNETEWWSKTIMFTEKKNHEIIAVISFSSRKFERIYFNEILGNRVSNSHTRFGLGTLIDSKIREGYPILPSPKVSDAQYNHTTCSHKLDENMDKVFYIDSDTLYRKLKLTIWWYQPFSSGYDVRNHRYIFVQSNQMSIDFEFIFVFSVSVSRVSLTRKICLKLPLTRFHSLPTCIQELFRHVSEQFAAIFRRKECLQWYLGKLHFSFSNIVIGNFVIDIEHLYIQVREWMKLKQRITWTTWFRSINNIKKKCRFPTYQMKDPHCLHWILI